MRQLWAVSYRWTDTKIQGTRLMLYQRVITRQPQEQPQVVSLLQRPNLNEESTLLARLRTFCNHYRLNKLACPQLNIAAKRTELWSQHTIINLVLEDHCDRHKILTCRYVKGRGVITDFFSDPKRSVAVLYVLYDPWYWLLLVLGAPMLRSGIISPYEHLSNTVFAAFRSNSARLIM